MFICNLLKMYDIIWCREIFLNFVITLKKNLLGIFLYAFIR